MWDLETLVETYAEAKAMCDCGLKEEATLQMCLEEFKKRRMEPTTVYECKDLYPSYYRSYRDLEKQ